MKKKVLPVILSVLLMMTFIPTALATSDTTPPALISCTPTKESYSSGEDVEFILKVSDENSMDVSRCLIDLMKVNRYDLLARLRFKSDISTDEEKNQGIYTFIFSAPVNDRFDTGYYKFRLICLNDYAGNRVLIEGGNLPQGQIYVEDTARTDFEGPVFDSIITDKASVSVGETIAFTVKASDPAGISRGFISYQYDGKPVGYGVTLSQSGDDNSLWQGSLTIDQYLKQGTYQFYVYLYDNLGNGSVGSKPDSTFYVSNPSYRPGKPAVEKIEFSKDHVKPGDKVTVKATVNPNGTYLQDFLCFNVYDSDSRIDMNEVKLNKDETGLYTGEWTIPANFQARKCYLRVKVSEKDGTYQYYYGECGAYTFPNLYIVSVFTGLENKSVLAGSEFDPTEGVSAGNDSQGDMTGNIEVTGSVNADQPGLYLLHYRIESDQSIDYGGGNIVPVYYLESRWIGVTETMPGSEGGGAPLALTDDSIKIGADSSSVSVKFDGKDISCSDTYTEPGVYSVSESAQDSSAGMSAQSADAASENDTVNAIIDRSGPVINATWQKDSSGAIVVKVKIQDFSETALLKYIAGEFGMEECKNNGTDFTDTFTVSDYGKYTVYSRDGLGNESIKTFNIAKNSINAARLADPGISGGKVSPAFINTRYRYKVYLGENEQSVTFAPLPENSNAAVWINGVSTNTSSSRTYLIKNGGSRTVKIKVRCSGRTHTYTFVVKRNKSTNNDLKTLTIRDSLGLSPSFDPDVTSYTANVDENTKCIALFAAVDAAGLARVNHSKAVVNLKNNQTKVVKFKVRAQSGAVKTYKITVHRNACTNANLTYIKTSPRNMLNAAFNKDISEYTITLPASRKSVKLSTKAMGYGARVTINGSKCRSKTIKLAKGGTARITIEVTAQDGTVKDYYITITRASV